MLFILFRLGGELYALETAHVRRVIPSVPLRPQPGTPDCVAGLFNYHGAVVPVLDLGTLAFGKPCPQRLSTRIILLNCVLRNGDKKLLGLIAESVTDAVEKTPSDFKAVGVAAAKASYFGPLAVDETGMIQRLLPENLLTQEMEQILFGSMAAEA